MSEWRTEHDSMGDVQVPAAALWRAQTQRAVENFPVSGQRVEPALIRAIAAIKGAAARANAELGVLDRGQGARDLRGRRGRRAGRARRPVPDRRVPDRQRDQHQHERQRGAVVAVRHATPTTTSTPARAATTCSRRRSTSPPARRSSPTSSPRSRTWPRRFERKAEEFADAVKSGRTHLMDATPVTLGQELGGYAAQVRYGGERLDVRAPARRRAAAGRHRGRHRHQRAQRVRGSGHRRPQGDAPACRCRRPATTSRHRAPGTRWSSSAACCGRSRSGSTRSPTTCAGCRSGPMTGLAEIHLPDLQPGSSIMPGKVNPVVPEAVCQVVAQVIGNDAADRLRRRGRQPRAQRDAAGDRRATCSSRSGCCPASPGCSPTGASTGSPPTSSGCAATPRARRASSPRSTATSATRRPPQVAKQAVKEGKTIRQVVDERGYVDAGPAHAGAARRGPRRPADDPPPLTSADAASRRAGRQTQLEVLADRTSAECHRAACASRRYAQGRPEA